MRISREAQQALRAKLITAKEKVSRRASMQQTRRASALQRLQSILDSLIRPDLKRQGRPKATNQTVGRHGEAARPERSAIPTFRQVARSSSAKQMTVSQEKLKQGIRELSQSIYGRPVSPLIGPDGKIFFASDRDPYEGIGSSSAGMPEWAGSETCVKLLPPFSQSFEFKNSNVEHLPFAKFHPSSVAATRAAVGTLSYGAFPTMEDLTAKALIGEWVQVPSGHAQIRVTAKMLVKNACDLNEGGPFYYLNLVHSLNLLVEGPDFSPTPWEPIHEWQMSTRIVENPLAVPSIVPPGLSAAAPSSITVSSAWNLGGKSGEFLVMAGVGAHYVCYGPMAGLTGTISTELSSIEVEVR